MSELERDLVSNRRQADPDGGTLYEPDRGRADDTGTGTGTTTGEADDDPAIELPGEDDYTPPAADVGDAKRGQGLDHMGGYGNRPVPQEGGPNQDH